MGKDTETDSLIDGSTYRTAYSRIRAVRECFDGRWWLSDGVLGDQGAVFLRVERQHHVGLRDARRFQLVGDTILCTVALYPDFAADNVKVQQAVLHAPNALPADRDDQIKPGMLPVAVWIREPAGGLLQMERAVTISRLLDLLKPLA